ncbi:MAG: polymer-forming cytoskeletal protein [bacterium]
MDILRSDREKSFPSSQQSSQQAPVSSPQAPRPRDEQAFTTLGEDTQFKGTLKFKNTLKIEGTFEGDISSDGHLVIGKTGRVKAEIKVGSSIVEGKVNGNITAKDVIDLRSTGELIGDIQASKLKIEEGVVFVGKADVQPVDRRTTNSGKRKEEPETKSAS